MSTSEEKFKKLQKLAENQKITKARLKGRIDSEMSSLKSKGLNSVALAKKKINSLRNSIESKQKSFDSCVKAFEEKYAEELQNNS